MLAHDPHHCLLTTDQRGRQPISPQMAARYAAALGIFDELTNEDGTAPDNARERLSELKGMANRVLRRDQADRVDVRRVLGSPDKQQLNLLRDLATTTNRALKDDTLDIDGLRADLARASWTQPLAEARSRRCNNAWLIRTSRKPHAYRLQPDRSPHRRKLYP